MRSVARLFALAAVVCMFAGAAAAEEPLLPKEIAGATREEWKSVSPLDLESVAGDLAPILREYGTQGAEQARYRGVRVTVYTMHDRSSAYGIFTLLRGRANPIAFGEGGVVSPDAFLFYQGRYLALAEGHFNYESLRPLVQNLAERSGAQASLPSLPDYLPEGRVAGSDAYVLGPLGLERVAPLAPGDWVGFAYGAEVEAARYKQNEGEATLLLISYPTPQIARARLADFQRMFNLNLEGNQAAPVAFARRKGSLVVFVSGARHREAADWLMERVRYAPELSWAEPQSDEAVGTVRGILNLMLGTALLLLVTLGLSLAFAGIRLGMKVWFPGRFLDKGSEEESLSLDIRPPK